MDRIEEALEKVFRRYGDSEEMRQLHQSILSDCEERYRDNLAHGMNEEEAYHSVMDSLGDLDDLLGKVDRDNRQEEKEEERSYEESIQEIVIRVGSRDVELVRSKDSRVAVEADADLHQMVQGSVLYLDENTASRVSVGLLFAFHDEHQLRVAVPDSIRKITVVTTSGDVELQDVPARELVIRTASGDISGGLSSERLMMQTSSGDVSLDVNGVRDIHIVSASGDIELKGEGFEQASCRTSSGDVEVNTREPYDFLEISTVSGDADVYKDSIDLSYHTVSGEVKWHADRVQGVNRTRINTISGDIEIHN